MKEISRKELHIQRYSYGEILLYYCIVCTLVFQSLIQCRALHSYRDGSHSTVNSSEVGGVLLHIVEHVKVPLIHHLVKQDMQVLLGTEVFTVGLQSYSKEKFSLVVHDISMVSKH